MPERLYRLSPPFSSRTQGNVPVPGSLKGSNYCFLPSLSFLSHAATKYWKVELSPSLSFLKESHTGVGVVA